MCRHGATKSRGLPIGRDSEIAPGVEGDVIWARDPTDETRVESRSKDAILGIARIATEEKEFPAKAGGSVVVVLFHEFDSMPVWVVPTRIGRINLVPTAARVVGTDDRDPRSPDWFRYLPVDPSWSHQRDPLLDEY